MKTLESMSTFGILSGDNVLSSEVGCGLESEDVSAENGNLFEEGNIADEVLDGLDAYWNDISDWLIISRMVSDSVTKGMVTAVEQEAEERIAAKELEMARLEECLQNVCDERNFGKILIFSEGCLEHDNMMAALHSIRNTAREQFKKAEKDICCMSESDSIKKLGAGVEFVGFGGMFQDDSKIPERLNSVLECLKTTVEDVFIQVGDILRSSKIVMDDSLQEQTLLRIVEDTVMQSVFKSFYEDYKRLCEQNNQSFGSRAAKGIKIFNELACLRSQLDAIVKSLTVTETGVGSHGSHDLDHFHRKTLTSYVSLPTSLCDGNGKIDESKSFQSYDFHQLQHLTGEKMVNHLNDIITNMRREHESIIQQKTEEYFSLKGEYLKEKGSFLSHRKDEEFDALRKKIPEVMKKLDDLFLENETFRSFENNAESVVKLKDELESVLSENRLLQVSLAQKKNEVKYLELQLNEVSGKLLQHSLTEVRMQKLEEDVKSSVEDSCIDTSLSEEVTKCAMKELIRSMRCKFETLNVEFATVGKNSDSIVYEGSLCAEITNRYQIDDSDIEPFILQGMNEMVLKEVIKDALDKLKGLHHEIFCVNEIRNSLQIKVLQGENELKVTAEQKEKLTTGMSVVLSEEREKCGKTFQELRNPRECEKQRQQVLIDESTKLKLQLSKAMQQIELDEVEMDNLIQRLDQTKEELLDAIEKRNTALNVAQVSHDKALSVEASERELIKEMEMVIFNVYELSKRLDAFEVNVSAMINKSDLRIGNLISQFNHLIETVTEVRRTGLTYRYKLERTWTDYQKAEAEVDLLGDEVDALLRLLERIYIALDHYSPILKHYPGIVEIHALVRRELSAE